MSYTDLNEPPQDISIPSSKVEVNFTCPRCQEQNTRTIELDDLLLYGFSLICTRPRCNGQPGRPGYQAVMSPRWDGYILGENDRPLRW